MLWLERTLHFLSRSRWALSHASGEKWNSLNLYQAPPVNTSKWPRVRAKMAIYETFQREKPGMVCPRDVTLRNHTTLNRTDLTQTRQPSPLFSSSAPTQLYWKKHEVCLGVYLKTQKWCQVIAINVSITIFVIHAGVLFLPIGYNSREEAAGSEESLVSKG